MQTRNAQQNQASDLSSKDYSKVYDLVRTKDELFKDFTDDGLNEWFEVNSPKELYEYLKAEALLQGDTHGYFSRPIFCQEIDWSVEAAEWLGMFEFGSVAKAICPKFQVREELKDIYKDIFHWCVMDRFGNLDPNKGLWLNGNVGVGKTTLLYIVEEFCKRYRPRDSKGFPYSFGKKSASEFYMLFCGDDDDQREFEDYLESYKLLIDDIGVESESGNNYGKKANVIEYVLEQRYILFQREVYAGRTFFTHVTTNLTMEQIRDHYGIRVFDRVKDMFNVVTMCGKTFRGQ